MTLIRNVDIDIHGHTGTTPLHNGCENGHLPIVEYLISKGVNIEAKDWHEETPLHYASRMGQTTCVQFLFSKGANKNAKNIDNITLYDLGCNYWNTNISQKDVIRDILNCTKKTKGKNK